MQLPSVITDAGPLVNVAAVLACVYFGVRLVQIVRQLVQGSTAAQDARQLRADLKEDHADQLQLLEARFEIMVKDAVREARRG
jgi:nitrogen fixation/metabolism regulation signal transduction histidine kinase